MLLSSGDKGFTELSTLGVSSQRILKRVTDQGAHAEIIGL